VCVCVCVCVCVSCAGFHEKKGARMGAYVPLVRYSTNNSAGISRDRLT
jgi:hypothetical protein